MRRLVQGDVGSGKTMIALHAVAMAVDTGCQAAVMAPTEILATQHYLGLAPMLEALGLRAVLLTGGSEGPKRVRRMLESGEAQVVFGTHALFQQATSFQRLGLVVIDEQHRFGVIQRQLLADKGETPDLLQLTATPIPRTLALTAYGHLDVSVLRHLPPGRQAITTRHVDAGGLQWCARLLRNRRCGRPRPPSRTTPPSAMARWPGCAWAFCMAG
jgi:ATP-dependent DNA helicase RecG